MPDTYEWKADLKNYYDKLKGVDLSSPASSVGDSFSTSDTSLGQFSSKMSSGVWEELGKKAIEVNVAPQLSTWSSAIAANLAILATVCSMVSELVGLLSKLDTLIQEYNKIKLSDFPTGQNDQNGNPIYDQAKYIAAKKAKYGEIQAKEGECYAKVSAIKSTGDGVQDIKVEVTTVEMDGSTSKQVMSLDEFVKDIDDNITIGLDLANFVDYDQTDPRWGNDPFYGAGNIFAYTGCGPTSAAMILRYLTGDSSITPDDLGEFASTHGYTFTGGTTGEMFAPAAAQYGITVTTQSSSSIADNLRAGNLVIVATNQYGGHFIAIKGITEDGNYIISDPYEPAGGTSLDGVQTPQMINSILQTTNVWVFEPNEVPNKEVKTIVE